MIILILYYGVISVQLEGAVIVCLPLCPKLFSVCLDGNARLLSCLYICMLLVCWEEGFLSHSRLTTLLRALALCEISR